MNKGVVKWFNNAKGYGFILAEGSTEDIFAHYSTIDMNGYRTLKTGQAVLFEAISGDKGLHAIVAHQSLADLRDVPADLDPDSVVGSVIENTALKIIYKLQDPDTAEWIAKRSGIKLVDEEMRSVNRNAAQSEILDD